MTAEKIPAIAIDGPASSGKSTLAREVARRMGFLFVDTGSLYRAVALALIEKGVTAPGDPALPPLLKTVKIDLKPSVTGSRVSLDGVDVTDRLRSEEVGRLSSLVSAVPAVRETLFDIQRKVAKAGRIVMDGRDIGTVILPEAKLKIFLVADDIVRAKRRLKDLRSQGDDRSLEIVLADIRNRDQRDRTRPIAPLVQAPDALLLDTTHLSVEEAVQWIIDRYR